MFGIETVERYVAPLWTRFYSSVRAEEHVAFIYHADLDGVVGGAYACANLLRHVPSVQISPRWVTTSDYSFEDLKKWVSTSKPPHAVFTDISIENHPNALREISALIPGQILIYDDHIVADANAALPSNVILVNPTLANAQWAAKTAPAFLFGYALAREANLIFPEWLLLLATFVEGVDEFYNAEATTLLKMPPDSPAQSLRTAFRKTPVARVSPLVRAEFSTDTPTSIVFDALRELATGRQVTFDSFHAALRPKLESVARSISDRTTRYIDDFETRIKASSDPSPRAYFIALSESLEVIGPVCSVLRGKFPQHAFIGRVVKGEYATYELRIAHRSPIDLTSVLSTISNDVSVASHGGHPSGAGALVAMDHVPAFELLLAAEFLKRGFAWGIFDGATVLLDRHHS